MTDLSSPRPLLVIPFGPPASGKSTLAEKFQLIYHNSVVSADHIRELALGDRARQEENDLVWGIATRLIRCRIAHGLNIFWDSTNLWGSHRDLCELAETNSYRIWSIEMTTPRETCEARNASRPIPVPPEIMQDMWDRFERMDRSLMPGLHLTSDQLDWSLRTQLTHMRLSG